MSTNDFDDEWNEFISLGYRDINVFEKDQDFAEECLKNDEEDVIEHNDSIQVCVFVVEDLERKKL